MDWRRRAAWHPSATWAEGKEFKLFPQYPCDTISRSAAEQLRRGQVHTIVTFADESYYTAQRFQSLAAVTLPSKHQESVCQALKQLLLEIDQSKKGI